MGGAGVRGCGAGMGGVRGRCEGGGGSHLMKPTWHFAISVFSRSIKGEIGSPLLASVSPCRKNSSIT